MQEMSEYEAQAEAVRKELGFEIKIAFKGDKCPIWCDGGHCHGDRYRVTIKRNGSSYSFDFWNSRRDLDLGNTPGSYDILSCLEFYTEPDLEEFVREFGYEIDSVASFKKVEKIHKACLKMSTALERLFNEEEIRKLQEIQ